MTLSLKRPSVYSYTEQTIVLLNPSTIINFNELTDKLFCLINHHSFSFGDTIMSFTIFSSLVQQYPDWGQIQHLVVKPHQSCVGRLGMEHFLSFPLFLMTLTLLKNQITVFFFLTDHFSFQICLLFSHDKTQGMHFQLEYYIGDVVPSQGGIQCPSAPHW